MSSPLLHRFLGGAPFQVITRLVFVSLIVGALMTWLDLRPHDVIMHVLRLAQRVWDMGFDAVREVAEYIFVGALIVVPMWLVARIFDVRRPHGS